MQFASPGGNEDGCFAIGSETTLKGGADGEAGVEDRASLVRATQRNRTKREKWK